MRNVLFNRRIRANLHNFQQSNAFKLTEEQPEQIGEKENRERAHLRLVDNRQEFEPLSHTHER